MIAWSSKLRPAFLERETRSELFGPRTWLSAVRWTSRTPPRQRVRSVFSLCLQTPVRQSRLTRSPATTRRLCRSHSLCCARAVTAHSTSSAPVVTAGPRMCLVNGIQIPVPLYHDRLPGRCKLEFERVSATQPGLARRRTPVAAVVATIVLDRPGWRADPRLCRVTVRAGGGAPSCQASHVDALRRCSGSPL